MPFGKGLNPLCRRQSGIRKNLTSAKSAAEENRCRPGRFLKPSCTCSEPAVSGKRFQRNVLEAPARSTPISCIGCAQAFLSPCGEPGLPNTMKWRASLGAGKASTGRWSRLPCRSKRLVGIRPTGEKNGTKRHLLVDGRGVPLSLVVTGANRHDVTQLELVLEEIVIDRPTDIQQNLCADKAYDGKPALRTIVAHGYIPHVKTRGRSARKKSAIPHGKPEDGSLK
ncbi:hypothetical protein TRIP_B50156 [uncultured Desulfatiglans sp.]|nr:hypothetical protein TRIP_B50156 [uncultured Desulfatiglans sp.]